MYILPRDRINITLSPLQKRLLPTQAYVAQATTKIISATTSYILFTLRHLSTRDTSPLGGCHHGHKPRFSRRSASATKMA